MTRVIERERLHRQDPRLGRHILHDSESRRYAFRAPVVTELRAVRHQRYVPIFNQGAIGSCTGNAAVGCLATGPFYATVNAGDAAWLRPLDETAAVACYSQATAIDPWPGTYKPEDTGSDGLSVAKVLTQAGAIAGYQHTFTLLDALAALMDRPLITGTWWTYDMYEPTRDGLVTPSGRDVGGHEYVVAGYDPVRGWVWFDNSWSPVYGVDGSFAMEAERYGDLLARDGDVTVFTPATEPAPVPDPPSPADAADRALWDNRRVRDFAGKDCHPYRPVRAALRAHRDAKGLN